MRDPEHYEGEVNRANFAVAVGRRAGGAVELPVTVLGDLADTVQRLLVKGRPVAVEAYVQTYPTECNGRAGCHLELVATRVESLAVGGERQSHA